MSKDDLGMWGVVAALTADDEIEADSIEEIMNKPDEELTLKEVLIQKIVIGRRLKELEDE